MLLFNMVSEELKRAKGVRILSSSRLKKSRKHYRNRSQVTVLLSKVKSWISSLRRPFSL